MEEKILEDQVSQPVLEQTPVVVEKKKVSPLTIVVLLVVILLVGVGGIYAGMQLGKNQIKVWVEPPLTVATPEPTEIIDETSTWKTYISKNKEYQIKYPPQYKYRECEGSVDFDLEQPSVCGLKNDVVYPISIYEYDKGTLDQFIDGSNVNFNAPKRINLYIATTNDYYQISKKEINLAGKSYQQAIKILKDSSPKNMPGLYYEGIFTGFPVGDKVFIVVNTKKYQDSPNIQRIYDQILSTFKFLD